MERTLHRQLKELYASGSAGAVEVRLEQYRIDAVEADGTLVEVQTGALGPLRRKVSDLLERGYRLRLVKPVVVTKRIVRNKSSRGPVVSARHSPKRGHVLDVFDDLTGLARWLGHAGLSIDVLCVAIEEMRVPRKRWPGFRVLDRRLVEIVDRHTVQGAQALWSLLPDAAALPSHFTTADLAEHVARPLWFAQRVAYCLHHAGAAPLVGKRRNLRVYARPSGVAGGDSRAAS